MVRQMLTRVMPAVPGSFLLSAVAVGLRVLWPGVMPPPVSG